MKKVLGSSKTRILLSTDQNTQDLWVREDHVVMGA